MGMIWFIMSEVMFFACFFGALLYARQLALPWLGGSWFGSGNPQRSVARLHQHLALQRSGNDRRRVRVDGSLGYSGAEYRHPADQRRHAHDCPSRPEGQPPRHPGHVPGHHGAARHRFHGLSGLRVQPCVLRTQPQAEHRHLRQHIFHADRVPRSACHHRRDHAVGHAGARTARTLHAARHFAFEATAWYWHFVDVVWLGLFIFVYWL